MEVQSQKELPVVKKAKASFRVALWNFSAYPKLILKNYQTLCSKRLDFQTVAWGQGQSLLTSSAVLVMSTITKLKSSLFCKLGEDMNCCFTSEGGLEQGFHNIPSPYTPARIKKLVGKAQVYVRPLQQDLDVEENEPNCTTVKVSKSFSPAIKFPDMK